MSRQVADFRVVRGEPSKHKLPVVLKNKDGRRREVAIVPDAYIAVKFDARNYGVYFVEVDRSTMGSSRWAEKIEVYREYPRTQHFKDTYKAQWCITLTIAPSEKRITALAEKTAGRVDSVAFGSRPLTSLLLTPLLSVSG